MSSEPTPPYVIEPPADPEHGLVQYKIRYGNGQYMTAMRKETADIWLEALNTAWLAGYAACKAEQKGKTE